MGAGEEILTVLRRIEQKLDRAIAGGGGDGPEVAADADLDSQWGDEEVKKSPPRWRGDDYAGKRMSECPPDFLDAFAEFKDYCADRDERKVGDEKAQKYAGYNRRSAARARGWAKRLRAGWRRPGTAEPDAGGESW